MDCEEARTYLLDRGRGILPEEAVARLDGHLASCPECRHAAAADAELSILLEGRLRRPHAPEVLRRALEARWGEGTRRRIGAGARRTMAAMASGAAIAIVAMVLWRRAAVDRAMVIEAVNDHLRVLYSDRPLGVEAGGIHQVKPWFEGRVDFAPIVPFDGDEDFALQGGAVGYFLDRKAATFVYRRRLHLITLLVFPADGLPWPAVDWHSMGSARATSSSSRGFHVLLWRQGDLGYALVSDVDERDLGALGSRIAR
jgi:anti-sigma factor RsiW